MTASYSASQKVRKNNYRTTPPKTANPSAASLTAPSTKLWSETKKRIPLLANSTMHQYRPVSLIPQRHRPAFLLFLYLRTAAGHDKSCPYEMVHILGRRGMTCHARWYRLPIRNALSIFAASYQIICHSDLLRADFVGCSLDIRLRAHMRTSDRCHCCGDRRKYS